VRAIRTGGVPQLRLGFGAPELGAVVMGTGIVSVALSLDGAETLSRILLALAAGIWLGLAVLVPARAVSHPARLRVEARTPPALSWVAGTGVVGARVVLLGWTGVGAVLLVVAALVWAWLIGGVLADWRTPTVGASLLLTVATQSLAVLAAAVALRTHASWLEFAALVPFGLGLASYAWVMARFDLHQLAVGRGDHWITGGALAISTLVAANLVAAARALGVLGSGHGALEVLAVALWVASMVWLPVLLVAEALRPRLSYDVRRWSTVFPLGMYAACSFAVGNVAGAGAITSFARVWVWVAFVVWATVLGAGIAAEIVRARTT
jgi:tellurite resistance protein TehA-like permease